MKTIMNKLIATCILSLLVGALCAQDTLSRSNVSNGGAWLTKSSYTLFGTFGQPGVATNITSEDGVLSGSVGFIGPVNNIGQNNPPVASTTSLTVFVEDSIIELSGFDPDGDEIFFEIVAEPQFGTLTQVQGGQFEFLPNAGLNPGQLYTDELTFRVNDGSLNSEDAVFNFQFIMEDAPHEITGVTFDGTNMSLSWEDVVPNDSYAVELDYYDLSDATNPGFKFLINQSFNAADLIPENGLYSVSTAVSATEHPYVFDGDQVFITASVTTPNGVGAFEAIVLDNTTGARTTASSDGEFFAFGSSQTVRENGKVELSFYSVELSDFDAATTIIELLDEGSKGNISDLTVKESTDVLKEWSVTYESTQQVGGKDSIEFRVFNQDRQLFDTAYVRIDIIDVNDPPKLARIANQVTEEDVPLQVNITPTDPDNEVSVIVESNEATLAPATYENGVITVSPQNNFSGRVSVNVIVEEVDTDENYVAYRKFDVEVLDVDDSPVVNAIPNTTIDEDNTLTFIASATDVDATLAVFTYSAEVNDPSAIDVEVDGSTIQLIPKPNVNGTYTVSVFADDGLGKPTSVSEAEVFELVINPINDEPEILKSFSTQQIITGLPDYTINLGAYFTDVENGSDLTYTFAGNSEIGLSISNTILTVSPSESFNSIEEVTVTASDGENEVSQTVSFVYIQSDPNVVIVNAVADFTLEEDFGTSTLDVSNVFANTNDPNAVFEFNLTGGGFTSASINEEGLITFESDENFNGTETFYLFGSVDGQANYTSFTLEVTPVNDPPVVSQVSAKEMIEDQILSGVFLSVADVDNSLSELTITASSSDTNIIDNVGITNNILSSGFSFSFTPIANANGSTTIEISISDGGDPEVVSFDLNVLPVNDAPFIKSASIGPATEDVSYSLNMTELFGDVDGDALSFSSTEKPEWLTQTGNILSGTPANSDVGVEPLKIRVDDSKGGTVVQMYDIEVLNVNDAPTLVSEIAPLELLEDFGTSTLLLDNKFEDIDGDVLIYTASSDNEAVVTVSVSGSELILTEVSNGSSTIIVSADDGNGGNVETSFAVTVNNVNDAPVAVSGIVDQEIKKGFSNSTIDLANAFEDEDGDQIRLSAASSNVEVVAVTVSGTTLSILERGEGVATITVTGSDGNGGEASFEFDFTVIPLGVNAVEDYHIYPNPVSKQLYIKGTFSEVGWRMIDTSGRIIKSDRLSNGEAIDVSNMNTGIYYLRIDGTNQTLKVIIRR
ncbi:Ig-like domain-containing protein [Ekhidna sp.]|uniref:Ig-like domain-containing protein n=1 Tax=Ekhidna sp. TaxID=2608089 RepID=UPI003CCC442C